MPQSQPHIVGRQAEVEQFDNLLAGRFPASWELHALSTEFKRAKGTGDNLMATYVEYELEDGSTLLIETDEQVSGVVKASRDKDGNVITKAAQKFEKALAAIKPSAAALREQLNDLKADEVEVAFGLKATGEAGNFAIGKVGMEANYEVTLKWSNKPTD